MWTTEAWMPYPNPPTGEKKTGSQPQACHMPNGESLVVEFSGEAGKSKPLAVSWTLASGFLGMDLGSRISRPPVKWLILIVRIDILYLQHDSVWGIFPQHVYRDWKCGAWSAQVISSCKIKELFLILPNWIQIHVVPCSSAEVTAKDRLSTGWAKDCLSKGLIGWFFENKDVNLKFGGLAVKLFSENFAKQQPVAEEGVSPWFLLSHGSQICDEKDIVAHQRVKCRFDVMGDIFAVHHCPDFLFFWMVARKMPWQLLYEVQHEKAYNILQSCILDGQYEWKLVFMSDV